MSNVFDAKEIIETTTKLKSKIKRIDENLFTLNYSRQNLLSNNNFSGQFADSVKSYNEEVQEKASLLILTIMQTLNDCAEKLVNSCNELDGEIDARFELDYINDFEKNRITSFEASFNNCYNSIKWETQKGVNRFVEKTKIDVDDVLDVDFGIQPPARPSAMSNLKSNLKVFDDFKGWSITGKANKLKTLGKICRSCWFSIYCWIFD